MAKERLHESLKNLDVERINRVMDTLGKTYPEDASIPTFESMVMNYPGMLDIAVRFSRRFEAAYSNDPFKFRASLQGCLATLYFFREYAQIEYLDLMDVLDPDDQD